MSEIKNILIDPKDIEHSISSIKAFNEWFIKNHLKLIKLGMHPKTFTYLKMDKDFMQYFFFPRWDERSKPGFQGTLLSSEVYTINIKENFVQGTSELFAYELTEFGW